MTIDEDRFEIASSQIQYDFSNHTLILPCVSIGSIPQLAIDALLESSNAKRIFGEKVIQVATLDHRFCVPFLGGISPTSNDDLDDNHHHIQGPLTLYSIPTKKVTILQQRSPILKSCKYDFAQALMKWISKEHFSEVIILTSLDAGLRTDAQMKHPFWYYSEHNSSHILSAMKTTLPKLESTTPSSNSSLNLPLMPSGGLVRTYLQEASSQSIKAHALITFAAEGDNRSDALSMAVLISTFLDDKRQESLSGSLKEPKDWSLLFGSQINDSMFN